MVLTLRPQRCRGASQDVIDLRFWNNLVFRVQKGSDLSMEGEASENHERSSQKPHNLRPRP